MNVQPTPKIYYLTAILSGCIGNVHIRLSPDGPTILGEYDNAVYGRMLDDKMIMFVS